MPSAARVSWAKFRVAMVIVAGNLILGTFAYLLTSGKAFESKATLYLYPPEATGLEHGAPVRVNGIDVGKVDTVRLTGARDPDRAVRVTMRIERDRLDSITADSWAQIASGDLVGNRFVDVSTGRASGHVPEGGEITYRTQQSALKSLDLTQFDGLLHTIDSFLADLQHSRTPAGKFIHSEGTYRDLIHHIENLETSLSNAREVTSQAGALIYSTATFDRWQGTLVRLDQSLAALQTGESGRRYLQSDAAYAGLLASLASARRSLATLSAAPLLSSDEQYRAWLSGAAKLAAEVDEFGRSPAMTSDRLYVSLDSTARSLSTQIHALRADPRKFLRKKIF